MRLINCIPRIPLKQVRSPVFEKVINNLIVIEPIAENQNWSNLS